MNLLLKDKRVYIPEVFQNVKRIVIGLWKNGNVEMYGSFVTGLSILTSDLDLVVSSIADEREEIVQCLYQLAAALEEQPWVKRLNRIAKAKVPVIKFEAEFTAELGGGAANSKCRVLVDISFAEKSLQPNQLPNADTGLRVHTGCAAARLVQAYVSLMPALKSLALVLKQFLYLQNLNDTYTGGLSSYCLVVLIVGFLQACASEGDQDVGELLITLLKFYGGETDNSGGFRYESTGLRVNLPDDFYQPHLRQKSVKRPNFFSIPNLEQRDRAATLHIEDPFNPRNNIGQSVFQFYRVQYCFREAAAVLLTCLDGSGPLDANRALQILTGATIKTPVVDPGYPYQNQSHAQQQQGMNRGMGRNQAIALHPGNFPDMQGGAFNNMGMMVQQQQQQQPLQYMNPQQQQYMSPQR